MRIKDILEYWAQHVDYDPDQKSFNLLSSNYEFNRCGKTMKMIMEEYDPSGLLSVMYAKLRYREILSQCKVNLWSLIENPGELDEYIRMRDMFNSPEIAIAEDELIASFNSKLSMIEGCPLIGEEDKQDSLKRIYNAIGDVCETLNKCNTEVYVKGNGDVIVDRISTNIHVYDTLAETLIALENAPDMVYICYIRQYQSAGGYFGIFVKSNGTILSVNDRVNEAYIGQHQNSRNGRWQDDKKTDLFPYSVVVKGINGRDYKGYAVNYIVSKENIPLKDVGADFYTRLVLAIMLLSHKLRNFDIVKSELTYTNALLSNSVLLNGGNADCKELIAVNNSLVAAGHHQLSFVFSDEDILSGATNKRFDRESNPGNREAGWYSDRNQLLVDLYGEGFHADLSKIVKYDINPLLTDGSNELIISEFVGSAYKMEAQAYRGVRHQLAEYIKVQMQKELEDFGGPEAVDEWFKELLRTKREIIIRKAAEMYHEIIVAKTKQNHEFSPYAISASRDFQVSVKSGSECGVGRAQVLNYAVDADTNPYPKKYLCPITGNTVNIWVIFSPQTAENIKSLFELEVLPKIVQGWVLTDSILGYNGNSILDNVDPVSEVQHILSYSRCNYRNSKDFYFAVGFSKRGINKLLKEMDPGEKV